MFFLLLLFCTGAVSGISVRVTVKGVEKTLYAVEDADMLFEQFILDYDKHYDREEKADRFVIFQDRLREINDLNTKYSTVYGINQFSDLTKEEFRRQITRVGSMEAATGCTQVNAKLNSQNVASTLDWRAKKVVTPAKNQRGCGGSYAYAITDCLESQRAIKTGKLKDLAVQQIVDCNKSTQGCKNGSLSSAGLYLVKSGLMPKASYKYVHKHKTCMYDASKATVKPSKCLQLDGASEEELKSLLTQYGPIATVIDPMTLFYYQSGIVKNCENSDLRQAVLLVGYNDEGNEPYWIVKNSWGKKFGDKGFFNLALGSKACRITDFEIVTLQM